MTWSTYAQVSVKWTKRSHNVVWLNEPDLNLSIVNGVGRTIEQEASRIVFAKLVAVLVVLQIQRVISGILHRKVVPLMEKRRRRGW